MFTNDVVSFEQLGPDVLLSYQHYVSHNIKMIITTTAKGTSFFLFSEKIRLDNSCESSAWQMIHMKCQVLSYLKNSKINF